ncbi:MAG: hypothetical protein ACRDSH_01085 [Pseudonocardiaceae bacterium]
MAPPANRPPSSQHHPEPVHDEETGTSNETGSQRRSLARKVAALKPDLILAGQCFGIEDQYDKLSNIAPVITYQPAQLTER